ncbi:serine hydrolase domain-containing protein [Paenibacillus sp. SI8]|uniref:serine hydrolase domain-containing protein n=1 Tax=unclassified Paenibacillus TaxID=185978 RepID=UPI00346798EF
MMKANSIFPRSLPESQGIAAEAIARCLQDMERRGLELHSFMLVRHGHVISEGWWAPYAPERPHMLFSLSKSFTSTAIGLLVQEGRISVQDRVVSFFPEDAPAEISSHLASMTIRDLLVMGTGHAEDTSAKMQQSDNYVRNLLELPVEHEPGTHFAYNSGATYLLSAILQKVTGMTLLEYLQPRLLEPLGIEGATWGSCPRGITMGGWGMKITTEDIAKFGQLYLQKGQWQGMQIVPSSWIEEATSKQIENGVEADNDWQQGYGYQFWRCQHGAYRGDGAFGQYCIVMPEQDAVIAITSGVNDTGAILKVIWEQLLPAMKSEELPPDREAAESLGHQLRGLHLDPPKAHAASLLENDISGIQYELADNDSKLRTSFFQFTEEYVILTLDYEDSKHTVIFGRNQWHSGMCSIGMKAEEPALGSATWQDTNTLELTLRYVETPFCITMVCTFDQGGVELLVRPNVSFGGEEPSVIVGKALTR